MLGLFAAAVAADASSAATGGTGAGDDAVRYGRDVRPILAERCFQCHGADEGARKAKLRLDVREIATADRGGYAAVVPGDAAASEMWRRVTSDDFLEAMPPEEAKKRPLSADELDVVRRWIDAGALYEPHWAFVAPVKAALPEVEDRAWARDEIDRFVLARLEGHGVRPAPEADAATLLRRVFLDLTGLPPTVEELEELAGDPRGYERAVEQIFTREPFLSRLAERLATPWLDAARYGDTNGIHTDNGRQAWLWRDQVLAALRENLPYDQFAIEQLAGDLLPDATAAQRVASGFNRNHVTTDEGGAIPEEYLVEYAVDRANTTGAVFLGLTVGCARCHDHKYDPTTQADYCGLVSFFSSIDEPGLYTQTADAQRAYEPFLEVPTAEQEERIAALDSRIARVEERLAEPLDGEDERRAEFLAEIVERAGTRWTVPAVVAARSSDAAVALVPQDDDSVLATGPQPDFEDYEIVLRTDESDLRMLLLEALSTPGAASAGAGRASHGNAVLTRLALAERPLGSEDAWREVPLIWAWADHAQTDRDFEAGNVLDDGLGWAADGNESAGPRDLVVLAREPFGAPVDDGGGSELRVTLSFRSEYTRHSLGRVRVRVSPLADEALLPAALGRWYTVGPFAAEPEGDRLAAYDAVFGPETLAAIDTKQNFGAGNQYWTFAAGFDDGRVVPLAEGVGASFVGRTIWSPDARALEVALGSDDGLIVFLNGERVLERRVDRSAALDQDRATLALRPGANALVLEIVNTGGVSGFAFRALHAAEALEGELAAALLPEDARHAEQEADFEQAWRRRFFEGHRQLDDERAALASELAETRAAVPRAMVMRELAEPRPMHVLVRGRYDQPDLARPVERATPGFLPPMRADARRDRLGLARWLVAPENPLPARVAVNRAWQMLFGKGLVRTSEDFGLRSEWPTHPLLLDWLAVEFCESGWDLHALLRRIVLSSTYRQSSRVRPELAERDPENRWLAAYPRRRLEAEQIRDLALFASGLLVERLGGPSVKPYQPEGLWREVAMTASNTREFVRDEGEGLWRRSLYTYWKRASPPPSLLAFDAPTRESCVIRRQSTNTPLQALVSWNDEQLVEAARALAARALRERPDDAARIAWLFRACTARTPEPAELERVAEGLAAFRERYAGAPEDAAALVAVGEAPAPDRLEPTELAPMHDAATELAAWTMIASAVLDLHETLTQD